MPVPWVQLMKIAPTVLSLTRDLRRRGQRPEGVRGGAEGRLRQAEDDLRQQAEVLHALAEQLEGALTALTLLRRRLVLVGALAGAAFLTALEALLVAWI